MSHGNHIITLSHGSYSKGEDILKFVHFTTCDPEAKADQTNKNCGDNIYFIFIMKVKKERFKDKRQK